jgi:hypothetical protein
MAGSLYTSIAIILSVNPRAVLIVNVVPDTRGIRSG